MASQPYLLGLSGSVAQREYLLPKAQTVIGRDAAQCDIVLPQAVVSRRHALIDCNSSGHVTITDLSGRNATYVNGLAVTNAVLQDGDRIGLGADGVVVLAFCTTPRPITPLNRMAAPAIQSPSAWQAGTQPLLHLGRASNNEIVLNAPGVSRHHATLDYTAGGQPVLRDAGSANGTFVNGELVTEPRLLTPQDWVYLGGFLLQAEGANIRRYDLSASRLSACSISKKIGDKTILTDISFALYPREFIGLMGPSGCGKSTLMDALNGLRPATAGAVLVNDLDLYHNFDALRRAIGYVPQRDILHDALTVERTLYYAARLRLPSNTPPEEQARIIAEAVATVGLAEQWQTPFRQLSGGQQKRLSLALELLTKPSFLFLDEPTSPLDPETTENMMLLFRRLADEGRIVVMVTHKFEKFHEMHHIALLTRGGRLAYFGPPSRALQYFNCHEPSDIYRHIGAYEPEQVSRMFAASPDYQTYVAQRMAETVELAQATGGAVGLAAGAGGARRFGFSQWLTLTQRYWEIKLKDRRNTFLLLAQAPIVAGILALIAGPVLNDAKTLFIAAIISIWFGANNAIREIVSETPIYLRERLVGLKIPSYVFSKFAVLSGLGFIQCLLFVGLLTALGRFSGQDFPGLLLILYLTSLAGVTLGLFFSALVNSTEKAMSVLPLLLIPQLLLSGFLKQIDTLYVNLKTGKPATATAYQQYQRDKDKPPPVPVKLNAPPALPEPVTKYEGLGVARYGAALMVARWTIDALAHEVSQNDYEARDKLAAAMTVAEYEQVLARAPEETVNEAYRRRVRQDCLILGGFIIMFLLLTMLALKRKDAL
jgi:ABC-type multidrug transport system ATPase subunit